MKKEEFMAFGVTEEISEKLEAESLKELKGFIPKSRFDEVNNAKKQLETDIQERNLQLEELKTKATSNKELQDEIEKLQAENKEAAEKYQNDLYNTKLNNEIDKKLMAAKAKDLNIAKAAFNFENVKLEDGKLTGFDEQLQKVQESHSYLFDSCDAGHSGTGGSLGNGGAGKGEEKDPFLQGLGL